MLEPRSRLLTWPNAIGTDDWSGWVGGRALFVPTTVDERYSRVIEMHDPGTSSYVFRPRGERSGERFNIRHGDPADGPDIVETYRRQ